MKYRLSEIALEDLADASLYYESQREGLGNEFTIEVGIAVAQVLDAPSR